MFRLNTLIYELFECLELSNLVHIFVIILFRVEFVLERNNFIMTCITVKKF